MPSSLKKQIDDELNAYSANLEDKHVSDYEKVTWIYRYISSRCKYDLNAANLPKGKDFVDFFLNKDKKGYCNSHSGRFTSFYYKNNYNIHKIQDA